MERFIRVNFTTILFFSVMLLLSSCAGVQRKDFVSVPESSFSSIGKDNSNILFLASLAPSGHNTQPWTVRMVSPDKMIIGTDAKKWLPGVDPSNRECMLSIGAFIENIVIAAGIHGYNASVKITAKNPFDAEIAEIVLTKGSKSGFDPNIIISRRTVRKGYLSKDLQKDDIAFISQDSPDKIRYISNASTEGKYLADATIEANRIQVWRNEAQEELSRWIRFSDTDAKKFRNGLTPESMEIKGIAGFFVRHFYTAESVMDKNFRNQTVDMVKEQVSVYGGWMVITSTDSSVPSLIETGRRFQKMFLRVRDRKIALHPMSQILEEKPYSTEVGAKLGIKDEVQFVIRTGYLASYSEPVSLRSPVDWFVK